MARRPVYEGLELNASPQFQVALHRLGRATGALLKRYDYPVALQLVRQDTASAEKQVVPVDHITRPRLTLVEAGAGLYAVTARLPLRRRPHVLNSAFIVYDPSDGSTSVAADQLQVVGRHIPGQGPHEVTPIPDELLKPHVVLAGLARSMGRLPRDGSVTLAGEMYNWVEVGAASQVR